MGGKKHGPEMGINLDDSKWKTVWEDGEEVSHEDPDAAKLAEEVKDEVVKQAFSPPTTGIDILPPDLIRDQLLNNLDEDTVNKVMAGIERWGVPGHAE